MMTADLKVSVVLCAYNGEDFLREQLDSILRQTRLPDEVLLADDASNDATFALLQAFSAAAHDAGVEVRVWRNSNNVGFVKNFQSSLALAGGDVIFLSDQDDVWREKKIEVMMEKFLADPELLVLHSDARLVDRHQVDLGCSLFDALTLSNDELEMIHKDQAFDVLLRRSAVTGATMALRRSCLHRLLPIGDGWVHDEWLALVASAVGRIDVVEEALIYYRQHGGNQLGARRRTLAEKWSDLVRPWGKSFLQEAHRLHVLSAHLDRMVPPVDGRFISMARDRYDYIVRRIALGGLPRWRRLPSMFRALRAGEYARYGTGLHALLRDILRHD